MKSIASVSKIRKFYADKTIMVTGGTGFMGKILVEKLLRSCPELKKIILVIRSKKDLTPAQRMHSYFDDVIFSRINTNTSLVSKVHCINGDITKPNLGLLYDDIKQLNNDVNIFIHSAANINFNQNLQSALRNILMGTNSAVELSQDMKNLQALIYVSSVSVTPKSLPVIEENVFPMSEDPEKLLKLIDDEKYLNESEKKLTKDYFSAYSIAKHLSENIMQKKHGNVPTGIFRPSIVSSLYREPLPGWNNNLNGFNGVQCNHANGLLRVFSAHLDSPTTLIPCDIAINALLALTWDVATNKSADIKVYNYPPHDVNILTRRQFIDYMKEFNDKYPLEKAVFYPKLKMITVSAETLKIYVFLYHTIPAYIIDTLMKIFGQKPRLLRKYKIINNFMISTNVFYHHVAAFPGDNLRKLWEKMSPIDREEFNYDYSKINWKEYMESMVKGTKVYILGEDINNTEKARAKRNRLMVQHYLWKSFIITTILGGTTYFLFPLL